MDKRLLQQRLSDVLQIILVAGLVAAIWEQHWFNVFLISGIVIITFFPIFLKKRFEVEIPAEFKLMAIGFIFASVFLGEVHDYYDRFWWWDIVLHTSSGFLLGIIGFLLVYVLNETEQISLDMKPGFVAFFAFLFALGMGVVWEIFEFTIDQLFATNMQKPMLGDNSGLTDTMFDLIVDTIGALIIAVLGYGYMKAKQNESFLRRWIHNFIQNNPRLFRRK